MKKYFHFIFLFSFPFFFACNKSTSPSIDNTNLFDSVPVVKPVVPVIDEASGIADSKANPGNLWVEEDSGFPPDIFLLSHDGKTLKTIYIKGAVDRDWEDMCRTGDTIYVADIGDNGERYADYSFYQFAEPSASTDTVTTFNQIRFKYPDGAHDAEAFLVDPQTKDIYIITKRDMLSRIYKLSFPYSYISVNPTTFVGTFTYNGVTSACISNDGKEIIVKTYPALYYYNRKPGQSIDEALQSQYTSLPYVIEPQGEAVTFATDNSGYFTLSEKNGFSFLNLYFYPRK
jgi:hypothetical protein